MEIDVRWGLEDPESGGEAQTLGRPDRNDEDLRNRTRMWEIQKYRESTTAALGEGGRAGAGMHR